MPTRYWKKISADKVSEEFAANEVLLQYSEPGPFKSRLNSRATLPSLKGRLRFNPTKFHTDQVDLPTSRVELQKPSLGGLRKNPRCSKPECKECKEEENQPGLPTTAKDFDKVY